MRHFENFPAGLRADDRTARGLSLVLTALTLVAIAIKPAALRDGAAIADRIALALGLVGMIGGVSHGFGHQARNWLLRRVAIPWVAWLLMAGGCLWLILGDFAAAL